VSDLPETARDTVFTTVALLRCRDHLALMLDAITEPRRGELARAIAEHEHFDDAHLRLRLAQVVRREHAAIRETVVEVLGGSIAEVPRVVRMWLAQEAGG
jgi:hypothetical protein